MPGARVKDKVTPSDRDMMARIFAETGSYAETARRTGWKYVTVRKHIGPGSTYKTTGHHGTKYTPSFNVGPPKYWDDLDENEKGWLVDFKSFRQKFFNRMTPPFQGEIADLVSSKEFNKLLVLCPPGHGKSQCFSVDYPIWEMIRNRVQNPAQGWACLIISKSDKMAAAFLKQIKRELETNVDLLLAYGRFKPEYPDVWKVDALQVEGFANRKEPTFISAGAGSHIYGWRVHLLVGDDIVDGENSGTPEKAEKLAQWHADELVSRLEPDGVALNIGTRFAIYDLHGKLAKQRDDYGNPIWHPVIYRAHDSTKCSGEHCLECKERCEHDKPWPDGCTLWPSRFSYRKLRALRSGQTASSRFEFIYNQYEVPDEGQLVKPEWIERAKNTARTTWVIPQNTRVMCTLDPSPTKYAFAECWAYGTNKEGQECHYLIACKRKMRMQAPEYLALMRDWTKRCRDQGRDPIWVVEINAAQRWLLQSTEYQLMRSEMGLTVIPHTTGRNKADPELGIGQISPMFEFNKVDLPWGDPESQREISPLLDELITYPAGETDDGVLAMWFYTLHVKRLQMPVTGQFVGDEYTPPWLMQRRALVDMRTGLRQAVV